MFGASENAAGGLHHCQSFGGSSVCASSPPTTDVFVIAAKWCCQAPLDRRRRRHLIVRVNTAFGGLHTSGGDGGRQRLPTGITYYKGAIDARRCLTHRSAEYRSVRSIETVLEEEEADESPPLTPSTPGSPITHSVLVKAYGGVLGDDETGDVAAVDAARGEKDGAFFFWKRLSRRSNALSSIAAIEERRQQTWVMCVAL